jgi:hypothetical protein
VTSDPRPGVEEPDPHRVRVTLKDIRTGVGIGLVLAALLVLLLPDLRTHLLGGTEERETRVTAVTEGTRDDDADRPVTTYALRWSDGDETRTATFRRSGPPSRGVGDTWTLWVSPDGSSVETDPPLTTWLWFVVAIPAFTTLIGLVVRWRERATERTAARVEARRAARRRQRSRQSG